MDAQEILDLLAGGRSETVEWLPERADVEQIAVTMAAMANTRGGTLLLGVNPFDNEPTGIDNPDTLSDNVLAAALMITPTDHPALAWSRSTTKAAGRRCRADAARLCRGGPLPDARRPAQPAAAAPDQRRLLFERGDVSSESTPILTARKARIWTGTRLLPTRRS